MKFAPGPYRGPQRKNQDLVDSKEYQKHLEEIRARVMDDPFIIKKPKESKE